jgi:hypothetical protein
MSIFLCVLSFALCYVCGRRSLVAGVLAVLSVGYFYGITRANIPDTYSHFIFDAGILGFYITHLFPPLTLAEKWRVGALQPWVEVLILWPLMLALIPSQNLIIRLVGLRGNIFLLPFLLIGARILPEQRYKLALGLAVLNLAALGFAGAEFFIGVPEFFPHNVLTKIIYKSKDVFGYSAFRIPATFANAHSYGGTMVATIPMIAGALLQKHTRIWQSQLLLGGLAASLLGVLLSATRLNFVLVSILILVLTFSIKSKIAYAFGWIVILATVGMLFAGEARLQRVVELNDTEMVKERVVGSVNMTFFELAAKYPFGNGLGGGGTSIPHFLQDEIQNPVVMENEYARIMLEQGIFGLLLWIGFIAWLFTRTNKSPNDSWRQGRLLAWFACATLFGIGLIGTGLFTSVPHTCIFFLTAGWVAARQTEPESAKVRKLARVSQHEAVTSVA